LGRTNVAAVKMPERTAASHLHPAALVAHCRTRRRGAFLFARAR
jgi:hypothetical protein